MNIKSTEDRLSEIINTRWTKDQKRDLLAHARANGFKGKRGLVPFLRWFWERNKNNEARTYCPKCQPRRRFGEQGKEKS